MLSPNNDSLDSRPSAVFCSSAYACASAGLSSPLSRGTERGSDNLSSPIVCQTAQGPRVPAAFQSTALPQFDSAHPFRNHAERSSHLDQPAEFHQSFMTPPASAANVQPPPVPDLNLEGNTECCNALIHPCLKLGSARTRVCANKCRPLPRDTKLEQASHRRAWLPDQRRANV